MKKLLFGVLILAALAAAAVAYAYRWYRAPLAAVTAPVTITVAAGESLGALAQRLAAQGVLDRPRLWTLLARREGKAARVRAGEYAIEPGTSPAGLLDVLVAGRVVLHPVTIVDGLTFAAALAAIQANPAVKKTLTAAPDAALMARLGSPGVHPEGQLYPDTYLVANGTSDLEILKLAHERLQSELAAAWAERAPDLPLRTPYEALALASIVEKETGAPEERPRIAGVFVNRLRQGMRLQTDPTVIYGLGANYDGNIRKRDLLTDTPYNTYTRAGLPPTPIALAGREALRAAVQPQRTEELFFVATGLGDGRHAFSRTLQEHDAAVARYLTRLRGGAESAAGPRGR